MEIALNCIFLGNCYAFSVKVCYINVIGDKAHVNSQLMTQDYKDHGKIHIIVHVPAATAAVPFQQGVPQGAVDWNNVDSV
ncbi:unnamed protein product [Rhizophagus irregularis]|nr:unnamed protein product [Rhizophagus irregularis]